MTPAFGAVATIIHFSALGALSLYGLHRIWLLLNWRLLRDSTAKAAPLLPDNLPLVTVQLPVYNERFVAQRLVDAVARLDWPADRLEIQVLDDSTDDTSDIVAKRVAHWQWRGIPIRHIRRSHRGGFKAGALAEGLKAARGEFVAIFDADFIPAPDFLTKTVPHFHDPRVGMVQTRWGFCNAEHSWLTGVQALLLGPHFSIEHQVRFRKGLFFNFNGTAGIWRRRAIADAGGWQADTVTEDLDLSYRAQLAGWRFVYLDGYEVPSELPVTLAAFRSQQQRWAKGSVQTARKILPLLLSRDLSLAVKCEAVTHLLANICWLLGTVIFLTLYPTIVFRIGVGPWQMMRLDLPLFVATSCAIMSYFFVYVLATRDHGSLRRFLILPIVSIGLAPSISLAVLRGLWSTGGFFERTPKFGITGRSILPRHAFLYRQKGLPYLLLNALLFLYSLLPLMFAWQRGTWYALPLFFLFPAGFLAVIVQEVLELRAAFHVPAAACLSQNVSPSGLSEP
ncbi:MAG: glycosyltransferase [Deltaproteobacteria bacterium]|nr:glycosyltransferase [Deltaproteobacteria bacterium]